MRKSKNILIFIHNKYYYFLLRLFYPQKMELYTIYPSIIKGFIIPQKILNINRCRRIPWPVHFTSQVIGDIKIGKFTTPGMSSGCYIQGINGIIFGDNVWIGPSVKIISANHDETNYYKHKSQRPIRIGNNVWIGANAIILPGVEVGDNCIIGAGSVVTHDIKSDSIAIGNPAEIIRKKKPYRKDSIR